MRVTPDMVRRFAFDLRMLEREAWPRQIEAQARLWHCHEATVRRRLATDAGLSLGPSQGGGSSYLPDQDVKTIMATVARSIRKNRAGTPIEDAIEICWREGLLNAPRRPAASTVRTRAREMQISVTHLLAPTPHTPVKSLFANHVHQIDASLCIQYAFNRAGFKWRQLDVNKLDQVREVKSAVHRWLLADHLSGAYLPMYFDSAGERLEDLLRFLFWAWRPKEDPRVPVCGLPEIVVVDRGAATVSHAFQNLCDAYNIVLRWHQPGNPRAKGTVEGSHWIHERHFESKLIHQRVTTVDELVQRAWLESIHDNADRPHSRHGQTRYQCWTDHVKRPIRVPVDDFEQFCWIAHGREETRQVKGDCTIRWEGRRFLVTTIPGEEIKVRPHPFVKGSIRAFRSDSGEELGVEEVHKDGVGFYSHAVTAGEEYEAKPATPAQQIHAAARDLKPFTRALLTDEDLPVDRYGWDPLPVQTVRTGRERDIEPAAGVTLGRVEAKLKVVERIKRPLTRDEGQWWNARLSEEGVTPAALEALLEEFLGTGDSASVRVA